jgi:hypothetical protein
MVGAFLGPARAACARQHAPLAGGPATLIASSRSPSRFLGHCIGCAAFEAWPKPLLFTISGTVTGSKIVIRVVDAAQGYKAVDHGTIGPEGSISGRLTDNSGSTGTWSMTRIGALASAAVVVAENRLGRIPRVTDSEPLLVRRGDCESVDHG